MKFKCKGCKKCPYNYNREYCLLQEEYIEDMDICPQGEQFVEVKDYFVNDFGEKIYYDELNVNVKY